MQSTLGHLVISGLSFYHYYIDMQTCHLRQTQLCSKLPLHNYRILIWVQLHCKLNSAVYMYIAIDRSRSVEFICMHPASLLSS